MLVLHRRKIIAAAVAFGLMAMLPAVLPAQAPVDDKALWDGLAGWRPCHPRAARRDIRRSATPTRSISITLRRSATSMTRQGARKSLRRGAAASRHSGRQGLHQQVQSRLRNRDARRFHGHREDRGSDRRRSRRVAQREQSPRRSDAQAAGDNAEARHQHPSRHAQAEHPRRARKGLVRREGRRGVDLPSRERQIHPGRPRADGGLDAHRDGRSPTTVRQDRKGALRRCPRRGSRGARRAFRRISEAGHGRLDAAGSFRLRPLSSALVPSRPR